MELHNYPEFEKDIINAFGRVINAFRFQMIKLDVGIYELKNVGCSIILSFDRGDTSCLLRNPNKPKDKTDFPLIMVYRYLWPDDNFEWEWKEARSQLIEYANICLQKLDNVMLGDFSWESGIKEEDDLIDKLVTYLTTDFDENHPIFLKYKNGDETWLFDLKTYVRVNNIKL